MVQASGRRSQPSVQDFRAKESALGVALRSATARVDELLVEASGTAGTMLALKQQLHAQAQEVGALMNPTVG